MANSIHFVIYFVQVLLISKSTSFIEPRFNTDCSDINYKQDIGCTVESDSCQNVTENDQWPTKVYDLKMEFSVKEIIDNYHLTVVISWRSPIDNNTHLLDGFQLIILPQGSANQRCFLLRIDASNWTNELIQASPRFRLATENIFDFGRHYSIDVQSLPPPVKINDTDEETYLHKIVTTPLRPDSPDTRETSTVTKRAMCLSCWIPTLDEKHCCPEVPPPNSSDVNCSFSSNMHASRWVAGFRRIFIHPLSRTISIEFVAAPEHYCFEAYEVRLLDESRIRLLRHAIITKESMKTEEIGGQTVTFGEVDFTNLEVDRFYVPAVLPIERSADGRCLCPANPSADLYSPSVVCSCLATEWKKILLEQIDRPSKTVDPCHLTTLCNNSSTLSPPSSSHSSLHHWSHSLPMLVCMISLLLVGIFLLSLIYHRYQTKNRLVKIRFINGAKRRNESPDQGLLPLIVKNSNTVLLLYSHDCSAHESTVLSLAEYLYSSVGIDVRLDVWSLNELSRNKMDFIIRSVNSADRILLINSKGAYYRYQAKLMCNGIIERVDHDPLDDLFYAQLDHVLGSVNHNSNSKLVAVRFSYTPEVFTLPYFAPHAQFELPRDLTTLLTKLKSSNVNSLSTTDTVATTSWNNLTEKVREMTVFQQFEPNWFEDNHVRHGVPTVEHMSKLNIEPASKQTIETIPREPDRDSGLHNSDSLLKKPDNSRNLSSFNHLLSM